MTTRPTAWRRTRSRAALIAVSLLAVLFAGVTVAETAPIAPATAEAPRTASLVSAKGCPRPTDPPKDAKALRDVAEPLRSYMNTAIIDARSRGLALYLVSGGRSDSQQWDLRHGRVPAGQECNRAYKGKPPTAVPGRSRHRNTGKFENGKLVAAADMGGALTWLHTRQACYGIHFPVAGENWHVEVTGRAPTCTIIPFDAPVARWVPFGAGETNATITGRGGLPFEVSEVQLILTRLGFNPGTVDGRYGPSTQAAMARFKAAVIKIQKATGQAPWPNTDPYVGPKTIATLRWWNSVLPASHALAA